MSDKKQWYLRVGNRVNIQKGKYVEPEEKRTWISKGTSLVLGFDNSYIIHCLKFFQWKKSWKNMR